MMRNLLKAAFIFFLIVISIQIANASIGKISGYVFDKTTGRPIPDANIIILNTNFGAASKDGGFYFIERVPSGIYNISARVIGYKTETKEAVNISANTILNFSLTPIAIEFDPILVTATLSDHRQSQVSVASEVLTQLRLKTKNAETVGEAVQSVGSVYFNSYDGIAGTQIASIRGSNADQVVVLLDGLRLNTAQGGGVDLNLLPVAAMERIEVVRGGHSSLVGSDAIGGAIQLISKETIHPRNFSYGMNSTIGSFGTRNLNLFGSHRVRMVSTFLNYNHIQTDGDFVFQLPDTKEQATRTNNDYQGDNFFLKAKFDLADNYKIQAIFQNLEAKKGNAGSITFLSPNARAELLRRLVSLKSENQLTPRLRLEGDVFYQQYNYHYKDPDGWFPTDDKHNNAAIGLKLQGQLTLSRHINLISGAEIRQDRLNSTKFEVENRNIQSLYALTEIKLPVQMLGTQLQWTTIPAIRWDHYSDVESQLSPKFGWLLTTGDEMSLSLRGNIGKSYRVPTFDDLYWPDEGWGKGNPDVKPETSSNFDVGLVFSKKTDAMIQGEVSYFNSTVNDLISWGEDQSKIWMPLNVGKANIEGIETGIKYHLSRQIAYLEVFHTWLNAIDETPNAAKEGKRLIYRPNHKLDILVGTSFKGLTANLNYRYVSRRFINADNSRSLSAYWLLNVNIGYSLPLAGLNINTKIQAINMLDKSLYLIDGYPSPGREFRLSLGINY